jgi:hypothetical protein
VDGEVTKEDAIGTNLLLDNIDDKSKYLKA